MGRTPDRILDELLVLRCQSGDDEALKQLVSRWDKRLRSHAWYLTGDRDAVADVVQDAWLEIIRSIRRLKEPASFRGWAFRIVSNKAVDRVRRASRQRTLQSEVAQSATSAGECETSIDGRSDVETLIREGIRALPVESRQILSMKYIDEMSTREIAHALDIPAGTVKSRLHHARSRLRRLLERNET